MARHPAPAALWQDLKAEKLLPADVPTPAWGAIRFASPRASGCGSIQYPVGLTADVRFAPVFSGDRPATLIPGPCALDPRRPLPA